MKVPLLYLMLCGLGFLLTLTPNPTVRNPQAADSSATFPGWPTQLEGRALEPMELPPREARFLRGFPGHTACFASPEGRWIVRWVTEPTRRLHPARHCFAGAGYTITPRGLVRDGWEKQWNSFDAGREGTTREVRERITDAAGRSWTDVSAWYWSALLGQTQGPWWVYTRITEEG